MRKKLLSVRYIFMVAFLVISEVSAGTTGKIAGRITDAQTGEALPGVNVVIEGMMLGAATDGDGYYTILNVPPGTYQLKATYIGYTAVVAKNTVVNIDLTTKVNFTMKPEVMGLETILVEAKRPVVVKDISNSTTNISAEMADALPVTNINQVLALQAGIESGRDGPIIRGGSARQTLYLINGFSANDERSNIPYTSKNITNLKEIQVQTGGFNAEYGDLRSGLVNLITKDGNVKHYTISFNGQIRDIKYLGSARKNFGPSIYDKYSYFNRPYLDPDVMWTGTANGAWDDYMQRQYPKFEGWNAVSEATMQDDNPNNDLTPEGAKRLYEWQHRRQGDITEPDYVIDASLGGPDPISAFIPSLKKYKSRFYLTYYKNKDMFIFPLSRKSYTENQTQLKYSINPSSSTKIVANGLYGEVYSVSPYSWTTTPTGRLLVSQSEIANLLNSSSGSSVLYMPGYYSPGTIFRSMLGVKLTHTLSPNTFLEAGLQYKKSKYHTFQMATRDTTRKYQPVPGYFVDEAPFGYWGHGVAGVNGMSMGGWMNLGRDKSKNSTVTFNLDVSSQITTRNQIKTGVRIIYNNYDINSSTYSPSMSTWTRSMIYNVHPYRVGLYAQDKIEFEGFIANVGARIDYSNANARKSKLSDYDKYLSAGYGDLIEKEVPGEKSKAQLVVSPRLGVSHPITENSKLYFNYGHFYTEPVSSYRFRLQRESNGMVTYIGNPDMKLEKTVAYELGFEQNLFNTFLFKVAAYYKDVNDQPGWVHYQNIKGSVSYYRMENRNYEDIRGLEITLRKRSGRWVSGFINYTYDVHTSGYFGLGQYYEDPTQQREYLRLNPYQSKPRPQPYARMNLNFRTPVDFGPQWNGLGVINNWNLSILAYWRSGSYYTYNPYNKPGVLYNTQWRDYHNVDFRLSKTFQLKSFGLNYDVQFFLDVTNAFNVKYMSWAGFSDRYDREDYLRSLNFSWEEGVEHGNDKIGDYRPVGVAYDPLEPNPDNDPGIAARNKKRKESKSYIDMPNIKAFTFLNPRNVMVGLKINLALPGFD